jgi:hypothetical protein
VPPTDKTDPAREELSAARNFLRDEQERSAKETGAFQHVGHEPVTAQTLLALHAQRVFDPTSDAITVRRGPFKFERKKEEARIQNAQELVRRVDPGPFEDPNYFALIAYQAASVEMAFQQILGEERATEPLSRFLVGTVHRPEVNAFAQIEHANGYTVVVLHSALVDFIYQSAKAVVEALNPIRPADGRSAVTAVVQPEHILAELQRNHAPVDRLYQTLESYFFGGYPRASSYEVVKDEHSPILSVLVAMAERWVIAHEYGHGFAIAFDWSEGPGNPRWAEEFFADRNATICTVLSAASLDGLPPEFALSGGTFALACLEILRRSLDILRSGAAVEDLGGSDHPPPKKRAAQIVDGFRQYFDVEYTIDGNFNLALAVRKGPPRSHGFTNEHSQRAYAHANVLFTIWKFVKGILLRQFQEKRSLHPMWQIYQ